MAVDDLKALVETVDALDGRVQEALELTELLRKGALPQATPFAYVIPIGLRVRSEGDAAANAFTQMIDEVFGVVLIVRSAGDVTGRKSAPKLDVLVWAVVMAVIGGGGEEAIGVYRLVKGSLLSLNEGSAIYQLDFAIQLQLRNVT